MAPNIVMYRLMIITLCFNCDSVASLLRRPESSRLKLSKLPTEEVKEIISSFLGQRTMLLQFLYDEDFEEDINGIVKSIEGSESKMVYKGDGSSSTPLKHLLTPDNGPAILVTFCSPQIIIFYFRMIHRQRLESHHTEWLIMLTEEHSRDEIASGLEGLIFEGTQVTLMTKVGEGRFSIFSSHVDEEGIVRFYEEGVLDVNSKFGRNIISKVARDEDLDLYTNMNGRELKVAVVNNFGLCGLQFLPDGSIQPSSGTDLAVVKALSEAMNFTVRLVTPSDGAYGNPLPNGNVTGMIGMVARREAHFAACSISFSSLRDTVIDFPYPYYRSPLALFSRAPQQKSKMFAILSPFTLQVWMSIIAITLIIGPVAFFQSRISNISLKESPEGDLQTFSFNLFRSLVTQSNRIPAWNWSRKILFFSWYLFCLVISASYSGMLTAVLAIPAFEEPIESLGDLPRAVDAGFDIGVYKDTTNEYLFREAKQGIYADTWKLFNHDNPEKSFVKGNAFAMRRVLERDFVYIGFMASCEIISTQLGRSKIHIGKETLYASNIGFASQPGVPYNKIFGKVLLKMVQGGLRLKWKEDELRRLSSTVPREKEETPTYAITLTHLQAAFFLVVLGYLTATILLVLENIVHFCSSKK